GCAGFEQVLPAGTVSLPVVLTYREVAANAGLAPSATPNVANIATTAPSAPARLAIDPATRTPLPSALCTIRAYFATDREFSCPGERAALSREQFRVGGGEHATEAVAPSNGGCWCHLAEAGRVARHALE